MEKTQINISTSKMLLYFVMSFVLIVLTVSFSAWVTTKNVEDTPSPTPAITIQPYKAVVCPRDFTNFSQEQKQVTNLIDMPKNMFATNGSFVNSQIVVTKTDTKDSQVACGYLLVKVHTKDGPLKTWENLYINPNSFGGHIDKSTQFGLGDSNNGSEYLFALNDMKYWKTKNRGTQLTADWAALLNVSETVSFEIALNTQDRSGVIDSMSISYKCWNPNTGIENSDCKLEVNAKSDTESSSLK